MKKHTLVTIMFLAVATLFAAACSEKEASKYSEESLFGTWKIPLVVEYPEMRYKTLTINPGHTAALDNIVFNYWKIEGDVLTLTRDVEQEYNRHELGVMKVTVVDLTDTTMLLVGNYIHAFNTTIDRKSDMSGFYSRIIPIPDIPVMP
ncbi:MAG: hypothetical protein ACSW8I_00515 [bacterium]